MLYRLVQAFYRCGQSKTVRPTLFIRASDTVDHVTLLRLLRKSCSQSMERPFASDQGLTATADVPPTI